MRIFIFVLTFMINEVSAYAQNATGYIYYGSACRVPSYNQCDKLNFAFQLTSDKVNYKHQFGGIFFDNKLKFVNGMDLFVCVNFGEAVANNKQSLSIWLQENSYIPIQDSCRKTPLPYQPDTYADKIGNYFEIRFVLAKDDPTIGLHDLIEVYADKNGVVTRLSSQKAPFDLNSGTPSIFRLFYDPFEQNLQLYLGFELVFERCGYDFKTEVFPQDSFWAAMTAQTEDPVLQTTTTASAEYKFCGTGNCAPNESFRSWAQYGPSDGANEPKWMVGPSSLTQAQNDDLSFYLNPCGKWINGKLSFSVKTGGLGAGNAFGMVWGWQGTKCGNPDFNNGWMFGWRGANGGRQGVQGQAGMYFAYANGLMPNNANPGGRIYHVWGNNPGPSWKPYPVQGTNFAWQPHTTYNLSIEYTEQHILFNINGTPYLDINRGATDPPFEAGKIGFFTYDQSDITFSDFEYADFDSIAQPLPTVCPGVAQPWQVILPYGNEHLDSISWRFASNTYTILFQQNKNELNQTQLVQFVHSGTYKLLASLHTTRGCDLVKILDFTVPNVVPLDRLPDDTTTCGGVPLPLDVFDHDNPSMVYEWSNGTKGHSIVVNKTDTLTLKATQPGSFCPAFETIRIKVLPSPDISITTRPNCEGMPPNGRLEASITGGLPPFVLGLNGIKSNNPVFNNLPTGPYLLSVTDSAGCNFIEEVYMEGKKHPVLKIGLKHLSCYRAKDGQITIDQATSGTLFSLDGINFNEQTKYSSLDAGKYRLYYRLDEMCVYDTLLHIFEPSPFSVQIEPNNVTEKAGVPVMLHANVSHADFRGRLTWVGLGLSCDTCETNVATICQSSTYLLTATDQYGCTATTTASIQIDSSNAVYVPNAFAPESELGNDRLIVIVPDDIFQIDTFQIFNRAGDLVFEQKKFQPNDPQYGWDGTFCGKKAQMGVYAYCLQGIKRRGGCGEIRLQKGNITLIR